MIIIAHDGQTTIKRVQRYRKYSGRFLMLRKQTSCETMYQVEGEFSKLSDAKARLMDREEISCRKRTMDAVFDMLTQEMWIYDSRNESAKKVYDLDDGWAES